MIAPFSYVHSNAACFTDLPWALGCAARLHGAVEAGACGAIRCLGWLSKGRLSLTCAPFEFSITQGSARDFNKNCGQVADIVNPAIVFVAYEWYGVSLGEFAE